MLLAPSLHRIGSDLVCVYLIEDDSGVTLVDAGLPGHWGELEPELDLMGRSLGDIRGVVLTHGDTDHIGFAERLRAEQGVPIYVHEDDADRARGKVKKDIEWGRIRIGPLMRFMLYSARRGGLRITPVSEVVSLTDGQILDLPGAPRVIHMPGHTPGSIAVHAPSVSALFVGDAITTGHVLTGAQGPAPAPFTLDPVQALASLSRLEAVQARWVLPGHGAPWREGAAEAVRLVRAGAAAADQTGSDDPGPYDA